MGSSLKLVSVIFFITFGVQAFACEVAAAAPAQPFLDLDASSSVDLVEASSSTNASIEIVLQEFEPPDNGGPGTSQGSGTR